mmetsp:Transcript_2472/g.7046  ORF Transcript_2472/g.7046 Transcript_2472/m.7046 type:complete len:286 (-) Transcript_2472:49-906(-)
MLSPSVITFCFKEVRVEEHSGGIHQRHCVRLCALGWAELKVVGVGTALLLETRPDLDELAVALLLFAARRVEVERHPQAPTSTLVKAVDAAPAAARRLVQIVNVIAAVIEHLEGGDTAPKGFAHGSEFSLVRGIGDLDLLEAAAFAWPNKAAKWPEEGGHGLAFRGASHLELELALATSTEAEPAEKARVLHHVESVRSIWAPAAKLGADPELVILGATEALEAHALGLLLHVHELRRVEGANHMVGCWSAHACASPVAGAERFLLDDRVGRGPGMWRMDVIYVL